MIKIHNIDIPPGLVVDPAAIEQVVRDIADSARDYWIMIASKDTSHLRYDYLTGILPVEQEAGRAVIALVGELPHLLEEGAPALDLRETLLGPKVPVAPFGQKGKRLAKMGGFYRAIPFRHMTPGRAASPRGRTLGQEMGKAYSGHAAVVNAKALGKKVHKAAKGLKATTSAPGKGVVYGGRLEAGMAPKLKPHHKTDIYAGMIREEKKYEKATQSQYFTFRTISTNVTEGWIRPAISARNYADKVAEHVARIAPLAMAALLEAGTE